MHGKKRGRKEFIHCKTLIVSIPLNITFLVFWLLALNIAYAKNTSK